MLNIRSKVYRHDCGVTLIEVLVTIVILAFGLLGLAGLQSKINIGIIESYQRGQAVVLLNEMAERMKALPAVPCKIITSVGSSSRCDNTGSTTVNTAYTTALSTISGYVTTTPLGTGDTPADNCSTLATQADRDKCEWSKALLGASETTGANADKVGAMQGARGCITEIVAPDGTDGTCRPGIYQITVAWQGMHGTKSPDLTCGRDQYGDETLRRAIATRVAIGLPNCQ
jgi:type IV pilus assembly protein PilV